MAESIFTGIVELDPRDQDDMLPAFFAYRMGKIPGLIPITFFSFQSTLLHLISKYSRFYYFLYISYHIYLLPLSSD